MKSERMFHQCYAPGSWLQQLIKVDEIEKKYQLNSFKHKWQRQKKVKSDNTLEQ
jgi:hypothetical protein